MTTPRRVYVVMCPNESCLSDVQVRLDEGEDVSPLVRCSICGEDFELRAPAVTE